MRILIVEDEVKIREGISNLITKHTSHTVVGEAKNGSEGMNLIIRYRPDLVMTDIRMPDMDGLQMLMKLQEMGVNQHVVILSGYSEFEYAKKAIQLGVDDYLLKPIGVEEVIQILDRITNCIAKEEESQKGKPETLLRNILLCDEQERLHSYSQLKEMCCLDPSVTYSVFLGYLGNSSLEYKNQCTDIIREIEDKYEPISIYSVPMESHQQIIYLIAGTLSWDKVKHTFERKLAFMEKDNTGIWTGTWFTDINDFHTVIKMLQNQLKYGLVLGNRQLLTQTLVESFRSDTYVYPSNIELKLKTAICNGTESQVLTYADEFVDYFRKNRYAPSNVKHGYSKMITFLINMYYEIDIKLYEQVQSKNSVINVNDSFLLSELETLFKDTITPYLNGKEKKEDIRNYTIRRAINYIREHYQEGITMEEVARKLEITPEYLSTLFNKEMKMTFSAFLKQFRISHAKRLLKGSDLKIYEIAQQVGYSDSKYFIRVFKEEQGISPGEYRQLN